MTCIIELSCSICGNRSDHKLGTATDEDMSLYHVYQRRCPGCGGMSIHDADITDCREVSVASCQEMPVSAMLEELREVSEDGFMDGEAKIDAMYDLGFMLHENRMVG